MFRPIPILINLAVASLCGFAFWYFLESVQTDLVHWKFACCDRCGNFLYEVEQPILSFCAGLSIFASTFLAIRGWKIIFKAFAVSWLCFQVYWLFTFWSAIHYEECTALNYPRGLFPIFGGIAMQIEVLFWVLVWTSIFLIYNQCRKIFARADSDEIQEIK